MISFLFRNKWRTAFLAYTIYIIYGTTLPFRFTLSGDIIEGQLSKLFSLSYYQNLSSSIIQLDGISNILFFIPFGLFFFSSVSQRTEPRRNRNIIVFIILSGASLSIFVESLQVFTVNRSPSFLDIITNTLGTYIGAIGGYAMTQKGYRLKLDQLFHTISKNPDLFLLSSYIGYLVLSALAPFYFNLSPFNIYWKLNSVTNFDFTFRSEPGKVFGILFIFAPAGYIFSRTFRRYQSGGYFLQTISSLATGFLICILVEFLQLVVNTRYFSWSDIYLGWIGVVYGLFAYQFLHRNLYGPNINAPWEGSRYGPKLLTFFIMNYLLFLIYKFSYPFDLTTKMVFNKLDFFLFDLYSYIPSKSLFDLVVMLIKNIILFIPAGIIFFEDRNVNSTRFTTLIIACLILVIKSLQLFNVNQTPLLYDFFGMGIGIALGYVFWGEFKTYLFRAESYYNKG